MYQDSNREVVQVPFEKDKWNEKNGSEYPHRLTMVDALLYTDTLRQLEKSSILSLLGEPTRINEDYLYYRLDQTSLGLMTLRTKTLVIQINSTRNKVMLHG